VVVGALLKMPVSDRLGLSFIGCVFPQRLKFIILIILIIIQMVVVVMPLFQIAGFFVQFLALPFPTFASSFTLGMVFQVSYKALQAIICHFVSL
jgi:hypothetical protein